MIFVNSEMIHRIHTMKNDVKKKRKERKKECQENYEILRNFRLIKKKNGIFTEEKNSLVKVGDELID